MWRWLLAAGVAWGCTCSAPLPPCELFGRAGAVFSGVVLDTNEDGRGGFSKTTLYLVRVEEGFHGLAPEQKEVFVDPGSFTSCYTYFEVGKKYLFYAGPGAVASVSFTGRRGEAVGGLCTGCEFTCPSCWRTHDVRGLRRKQPLPNSLEL